MNGKPAALYAALVLRGLPRRLRAWAPLSGVVFCAALLCAGLLGLGPGMKRSMDRFLDRSNAMDLAVSAPQGLGEPDLAALAGLGDVAYAMPAYTAAAVLSLGPGQTLAARVYGLPLERAESLGFINRMDLVEGRFPVRDTECLVEQSADGFPGPAPGAALRILDENGVYRIRELTVVGVVQSPLHLNSPLAGPDRPETAVYVYESIFALPAYTDWYMTLKSARSLTAFTPAYTARVERAAVRIAALGQERAAPRAAERAEETRRAAVAAAARVMAEQQGAALLADEERRAAQNKAAEARQEIAEGERLLALAEQALAEKRAEAEQAETERAARLWTREARMRSKESDLAALAEKQDQAARRLDQEREGIEKTRASWLKMLFPKAKQEVAAYDARREAHAELLAAYNAEATGLAEERRALEAEQAGAEAEAQARALALDQEELEIIAERWRLSDARLSLAEAERAVQALAQAAEALAQAPRPATDVEPRAPGPEPDLAQAAWTVRTRVDEPLYAAYGESADRIARGAAWSCPLFMLIAALAGAALMQTRAAEERAWITALCRLGASEARATAPLLLCCGISAAFGAAAGGAGGRFLSAAAYQALGAAYRLPVFAADAAWSGLIAGALLGGGALAGAVLALAGAVQAKRPPAKQVFLERLGLGNRLGALHKLGLRSLLQPGACCLGIALVAACSSLMLLGFGLVDASLPLARLQFNELFTHTLRIEVSGADAGPRMAELLSGFSDWAFLRRERAVASAGGRSLAAQVLVPQDTAAFSKLVRLRSRSSKEPPAFGQDAVVLTESAATALGLRPGDRFSLETGAGVRAVFTLSGLAENYLGVYCYLGPAAYRSGFGEPAYQSLWVHTDALKGPDQEALVQALRAHEEVLAVEALSLERDQYRRLLGKIASIGLFFIAAGAALTGLAFHCLMRRRLALHARETAALRLAGLHWEQLAAAAVWETALIGGAGLALGFAAAALVHGLVIHAAASPALAFLPRISPLSLIASLALIFLTLLTRVRPAVLVRRSFNSFD